MTREQAMRRWEALRRMTVARGCTIHEADTAAQLAWRIAGLWGFDGTGPSCATHGRTPAASRVAQDERQAARRFGWEYRRCGKWNCWCRSVSLGRAHGPYRYEKRRRGRHVVSIYRGRQQA